MSDERPGTVRLNKFLSQSGVASRRGADILIVAGRVLVDGVVAVPGTKVGPAAVVTVDGTAITAEKHVYLMMNKPAGFVTTVNDEKGRPTVMDLVDVTEHVVPVGRLDAATTGLLLLMNDWRPQHAELQLAQRGGSRTAPNHAEARHLRDDRRVADGCGVRLQGR